MRLRDYQNLLKEALSGLKQISKSNVQNNTRGMGLVNDAKVAGLVRYNTVIDKLIQANIFNDLTSKIRTIEIFHRVENEIIVSENSWNNLKNHNDKLIVRIEDLLNTVNNILPEEDKNFINLKIPEGISTISELNDFIGNLDIIFHIYNEFNCEVSFKGVETGSAWLVALISTTLVVKPCIEFLFYIAQNSLELRNLKLEGDKKLLEIEELKNDLSEKEYEKVFIARKKKNEEKYSELKCQIAKESISILKTLKEKLSNDNEVIEKAKVSIEKIGELLGKGMEIKLACTAPEEFKTIATQFDEKLEEHKQLVIGLNKQKLIEEKGIQIKIQEQENNEDNINEQ